MENKTTHQMPFERLNYMLFGGGLLVAILGFFLMSGGGSDDPNVFNEAVFSPIRITVAPLTILAGYGLVLYAILRKPKPTE